MKPPLATVPLKTTSGKPLSLELRDVTLRNAFERMALTEQEVRTFHGVITGLVTGRKKK